MNINYHIEIIPRKSGTRYRGHFSLDGQKKKTRTFKRKADVEIEIERTLSGFQSNGIPSFEKASLDWVNLHSQMHCKPGTNIKNQQQLREINQIFGRKKLNMISTHQIEEFLKDLRDRGLSNSSLNQRLALIKSIYNWHIKRGLNVFNPTLAIRKFKTDDTKLKYWTKDQCDGFLNYVESKYEGTSCEWVYNLYLIALNTGLRWGEILGLDWSSIDLENKRIRIDQIFDEKLGEIRSSTKSGRVRYVGINDSLDQVFQSMKRKSSGLVFRNLAGNPIDRRNFRVRYFSPDITHSGVPRIPFHGLRHTFATQFM